MTKSTITRERAQQIFLGNGPEPSASEERELASMALAAMDSEPVVECEKLAIENFRTAMEGIGHIRRTLDETFGGLHGTHVEPDVLAECKAICDAIYAAYRHAQPAPAAPVCTCPSGDGSLRWPCPVHPGNSPVIPDGWTGNEKANAALMMLDRIETVDPVDDDRIDGIKRIVRELAAAPHDTPALNSVQSVVTVPGKWIPVSEQKPDCWCLTCRPVVLNDMRFVVCPDCGNKRCPRANDHRDACTGSNEPGQEGSVYPAAQQEVKGE
ncbi:Uncharacterised protein [Klebsiella pneumoniae]|uniref:hypothetical protein n=1 Tax=Klebsiella pneumoniae TaxID=573 RepID=UPI0009CFE1F7|nr:hypothetical protein [Klebsiella pneumoniae]MEC4276870.1 hypothetical protein [Klebsiella pneumoniae]SLO91647.1 Uncharacterised protein [Klebsiella pneumoniae]